MAHRVCSCEGTNENCKWCSGLGSYETGFRESPERKPISPPALGRANALPICRYCDDPVRNISKHEGSKCPKRPLGGVAVPTNASALVGVSPKKISIPLRSAKQAKLPAAPVQTRQYRCPVCDTHFGRDQLIPHLIERHQFSNQKTAVVIKPPAVKNKLSTNHSKTKLAPKNCLTAGDRPPSAEATPSEYRENRRLDGSRDYWQIRENGRFGSHPSYDSTDDESAP